MNTVGGVQQTSYFQGNVGDFNQNCGTHGRVCNDQKEKSDYRSRNSQQKNAHAVSQRKTRTNENDHLKCLEALLPESEKRTRIEVLTDVCNYITTKNRLFKRAGYFISPAFNRVGKLNENIPPAGACAVKNKRKSAEKLRRDTQTGLYNEMDRQLLVWECKNGVKSTVVTKKSVLDRAITCLSDTSCPIYTGSGVSFRSQHLGLTGNQLWETGCYSKPNTPVPSHHSLPISLPVLELTESDFQGDAGSIPPNNTETMARVGQKRQAHVL